MEMKGNHERILSNFYRGLGESEQEFESKVAGYLCVYAPYYIHFIETEDEEFLNLVLTSVQNTIGKRIHEQVWVLHDTEEVPKRAYSSWYCKSLTASKSQAEIKGLPQFERIYNIYTAMI